MGIGFSTFAIALGAVLTFAVDANQSNGFNINSAGIILMVVGALGLVVSMLIFGTGRERYVEREIVERDRGDVHIVNH
jgi:hypothetical protein